MRRIKIYPAASLFNGRETLFNIKLTDLLESKHGYQANLPQRDGFEFGRLAKVLKTTMSEQEAQQALEIIIYILDIGKFIPESHVVIANLDEPLDPGVDVEQCYASIMGKFVLGFRTNARTPFGSNDYRGMHFFPTYQCRAFVSHNMPGENIRNAEQEIKALAEKIDHIIQAHKNKPRNTVRSSVLNIPEIRDVLFAAETLFHNLSNIQSKESLSKITERYLAKKKILLSLLPRLY